MAVPIVFAAVLSLLTAPAEKPLCCYATERGWIVYELGSPELHILRPYIREAFTKRIVLMSGKLTPSNVKDHRLSALVVENRIIVEYDYDFREGFASRELFSTRCRGECSLKDAFDGKMVDQKGQSVDLMNKIVNRAINADLLVNTENEIIGVNCYGDVKGIRYLGWFNGANLNKDELPIEMFKVACPFVGPFKVFHVNDRYYFVTTRGILYSSLIDKDGKPLEILPVFLGFGEPVNAVISVVDSKRVYVFTRNRYFELKNSIPSPKQLRKLPLISYLKSPWITVELSDRSLSLCRRLIDDKIIEPIKVDVK